MQFTLFSIVALAALATASPATTSGGCNGTSCKVGFVNYECNKGSCVGAGGGDGAKCTVVDNDDGSVTSWCPGCGDSNLC
ncbi:hypothetical protein F4777DRAFT_581688 [Nemania sp. FL0916]|nr:hypothetical protein F4777DRAFT_581688 [Nemania sp. FL0916]